MKISARNQLKGKIVAIDHGVAFPAWLAERGKIPAALAGWLHGHPYLPYDQAPRPLYGDGALLVGGSVITAAITKTSVEELKLEVSKTAFAIVKASDVMVGVE